VPKGDIARLLEVKEATEAARYAHFLRQGNPSYLEEWGEVLLGLALVVAPWTVGYESVSATVSSMVSGHTGDLVWSLGTNDRSRFHHLVARSLASPSQLRRVVA
jgi:hypothetical protein